MALTLAKILYCLLLSLFFMPFLLALCMVMNGAENGWHLPAKYVFVYFFPLIYFPFCYVSVTRVLRGKALVVSGLVMHFGLTVWALLFQAAIPAIAFLVLTLLWTGLCV